MRERTPRVDQAELLRRTFAVDEFACVMCGGRRRVLAYVKGVAGVRAIVAHLGLPTRVRAWPRREGYVRLRGVEAQDSQEAQGRSRAPAGRAAWAGVYPKGTAWPLHRPGAQPSWHSAAALLDLRFQLSQQAPIPPIRQESQDIP